MKYVLLGKMNPAWLKRSEVRLKGARAKLKRLGIKIESIHYTQGAYDFVDVMEAPNAEAMLAFSVWYAKQGYGSFQTMPAFSEGEMAKALKKA